VIEHIEERQGKPVKPLIALLKETIETNVVLDFGLIFTEKGELMASYPSDLRDLAVENYFASWEFGAHVLNMAGDDVITETPTIFSGYARLEHQDLTLFRLGTRDPLGQGAIGFISAGVVRGDFGDLLGICILGKVLNQYQTPLQQFTDVTDSAGVVYLDTIPLAYAGFSNVSAENEMEALSLNPEQQIKIARYEKPEQIELFLAGEPYLAACSLLSSFEGISIGSLCVGVPKVTLTTSQQTMRLYGIEAQKNVQRWIVGIGVVSLSVFVLVSLIMASRIVQPLKYLSAIAQVFATGNFQQTIAVKSRDEVGVLARAFQEMRAYIQDIATVADKISDGDVRVTITPRSADDTLNHSFQRMITYIQDVADITERISKDELHVEVAPKSEQDVLNISLQRMILNLQAVRQQIDQSMKEVEHQNWLKTGQAELSHAMRGEQDISTLAQNVMSYLAGYLHVEVGALYLTDEDRLLRLVGSYAYAVRKGNQNRFAFGDGLVGQAALEKRTILFTDVPDDYLLIRSGLGKTAPRYILVVPFLYENQVKGVIELGSVHAFTDKQQEFLGTIIENIAIAVHSAQVQEKMRELLEQTQQQAEELQSQQEQLRVNNEELEAQTDALRKSEQQLQVQQEELRQTNEELESRTRALEQQRKSLQEKNRELETARNQIEEKARELEETSRYKSEFLANMSHELRTPLNSLLILSKLLVENKHQNLTEKQVEFAQTIHSAGAELLELINEILDLSKIEAGKMMVNLDDMSLKGLMSYIEQNFRHIAEERELAFQVTLADGLPASIRTDRQRVEQILKNLLSNALKFTSEGEVRVTIDRPTSDSGIDLPRDQAVAISVCDTGIGIAPEKQRMIFEAFQQADGATSRKYGGTGLGLSIVREFSRFLGGEVHVHSIPQQGSTFTLYLPEEAPSSEQVNPTPPPALPEKETITPDIPVPPAKETNNVKSNSIWDDRHTSFSVTDRSLLIIEDDAKFAKILFDVARERGFKGLIASDGAGGLQLAYQYLPSAILLDIGLPGMDGWTVMEKLKHNPETRHIPVHFISALDQSLDAWKMGAIGYLTKPVSMDQLQDAFRTIEGEIAKTMKRLLLVEDDEVTQLSIVELLRGDDVEIVTAQTGQEAFQLLESELFDCMVLDLGLEDMSGFELLDRIHQESQALHLPIVIYTAQDLTKEEETRLKQHAESIVIKGAKSQERLVDEVTLFLHRVEADLPKVQQQKLRTLHSNKETVLQGKTVLITDDDMRNIFALSSILEEKGMEVLSAEHGAEALEILKNHAEIDIVLMDIMMPEMDGYEAIGRIRERPQFTRLPIIALTAKAMKGDRQRCIDAGANDYLSKPVDIDKLLSLLRVWLY